MPVTIKERVRRVEEDGSRRKRDLVVWERVKAAERRERFGEVRLDPGVQVALKGAQRRLRAAVPESTFKIWLEPLRAVGAQGATLYLSAPDGIRSWVERRYSSLLRQAFEPELGEVEIRFVDPLDDAKAAV
jgi:DnaA N-terminal domain